jgi:putative membrane protein insertion efficiency factor
MFKTDQPAGDPATAPASGSATRISAPLGHFIALLPRRAAHLLIRAYQLTFSAFLGRQCRYLPTCSDYADEAIARHGLWAGGFMATARLCRCHPWGGSGFYPVPRMLVRDAHWSRPWRYGEWRQRPVCEAVARREDAGNASPP